LEGWYVNCNVRFLVSFSTVTCASTSLRYRSCLTLRSATRPHPSFSAVRKAPDRGWSCLSYLSVLSLRPNMSRCPCRISISSFRRISSTLARPTELSFRAASVSSLIFHIKPRKGPFALRSVWTRDSSYILFSYKRT